MYSAAAATRRVPTIAAVSVARAASRCAYLWPRTGGRSGRRRRRFRQRADKEVSATRDRDHESRARNRWHDPACPAQPCSAFTSAYARGSTPSASSWSTPGRLSWSAGAIGASPACRPSSPSSASDGSTHQRDRDPTSTSTATTIEEADHGLPFSRIFTSLGSSPTLRSSCPNLKTSCSSDVYSAPTAQLRRRLGSRGHPQETMMAWSSRSPASGTKPRQLHGTPRRSAEVRMPGSGRRALVDWDRRRGRLDHHDEDLRRMAP